MSKLGLDETVVRAFLLCAARYGLISNYEAESLGLVSKKKGRAK